MPLFETKSVVRHTRSARFRAVILLLVVAACGGGADGTTPTPPSATPTVSAVRIVPPATTALTTGQTLVLTAAATDAAGAPVSAILRWRSSNPAVLTISDAGLLTALTAGVSDITVSAGTITSPMVSFDVRAVPASVRVTGPTAPLIAGASVTLVVEVRDARGTVLTGQAVGWRVSDTTRARISSAGVLQARLPGLVQAIATVDSISGTTDVRLVAPTLTVEDGFTGYHTATVNSGQATTGFGYGVSYHALIARVDTAQARSSQFGWGSWLIPNNVAFNQPLCPVGTYARDNWPERGPTYRDVFQTIEGGPGEWVTTRFPYALTKFRINSTPDCYSTQVASSAWHFYGTVLPEGRVGLAQLSNRLLVPPDGIPMVGSAPAMLLGYGWLALPLISAGTSSLGVTTGDQSWTLFLSALNFAGPVAFFTPELWTALAMSDRTSVGRGLDASPAYTGAVALEVGNLPFFTARDSAGTRWRRIPRVVFPTDVSGRAVLQQDVRFYGKSALWDGVASAVAGGPLPLTASLPGSMAPTVADPSNAVRFPDGPISLAGTGYGSTVFSVGSGQNAFGLSWSGSAERGVIPEYFRETAGRWTPVAASQVPRTTWLIDQGFPTLARTPFPSPSTTSGAFNASRWAAGPFSSTLADGSVVTYAWYRFVEQPAIARLGLSATTLDRLQRFVESFHDRSAWAVLPSPTSGTLTSIDPAALVQPPAGLTRGYVPVVIGQR